MINPTNFRLGTGRSVCKIRSAIILHITTNRIIAIIRGDHVEHILPLAETLYEGGVRVLEVTLNSPNALYTIKTLAAYFSERLLIGAGTVLEVAQVKQAADHGARFIISPDVYVPVIECSLNMGLEVLPGAYTPTEIRTALRAGVRYIKLFPASLEHFKQIRAPLNDVSYVPTGGINTENAADFLTAGAVALGIGSALVPATLSGSDEDWQRLRDRAARLVQIAGAQQLR